MQFHWNGLIGCRIVCSHHYVYYEHLSDVISGHHTASCSLYYQSGAQNRIMVWVLHCCRQRRAANVWLQLEHDNTIRDLFVVTVLFIIWGHHGIKKNISCNNLWIIPNIPNRLIGYNTSPILLCAFDWSPTIIMRQVWPFRICRRHIRFFRHIRRR